ncbi:MAG: hypothetical protein JSS34_01635 [Proteobacteria bacterium]|nr:hypothetical protein [Pseudomonadota bacterium]
MKILVVIGPAFGVINHTLALSNILHTQGHEVIWLTGYKSRDHLEKMASPYLTYYSDLHDLNFNANNPGKTPHFIFSCNYDYLKKSIEYELDLIAKIKPELIITKHHYSPTISARISKLPHAYYYTDGGEYFFKDRNPHNRWQDTTLIQSYQRAASHFGLICEEKTAITDYLFSPYLNIIRGVPLLSSLTKKEQKSLNSSCVFGGILTYDGLNSDFSHILSQIPSKSPLIYVTFGTHSYQKERIKIILEGLKDFEGSVVISTMDLNPEEFYPSPPNFFLTKYIPNDLIMEKSDLVIHHAGYGTTLTSYLKGVPQLVIPNNPIYTAQLAHANVIEAHECGKYLSYENLTPKKIKELANDLILNKIYKKNALKLSQASHKQDIICKKLFLDKLENLNSLIKNINLFTK